VRVLIQKLGTEPYPVAHLSKRLHEIALG
jgi:hypothetical protein